MKQPSAQDKPARRTPAQSTRETPGGGSPQAGSASITGTAARRGGRSHPTGQRYEGTEGNNALQSQPDDSREVSMLDSGKHSERSPYVAGNQ